MLRRLIFYGLSILSGGLLFLLFRMFPWWRSIIKYSSASLDECDKILVKRREEGTNMYAIARVMVDHQYNLRYFDYMCRRYKYNDETGEFSRVEFNIKKSFRSIYQEFNPQSRGYDRSSAEEAFALHGSNSLSVPVPNYLQLFIDEVLHPFYAFQVFTCGIWYWDDYWIYATCIVIISVISAIIGVRQARENRLKLHRMTHHQSQVTVIRDGASIVLPSDFVSPGDLIEITANQQLPCDIILLQGSCVINEASLTGESIPVLKSALPNDEDDIFDSEMHSKHVLFNGTSVMQVKAVGDQKIIGVAFGTGFATLKGELIRSILFPKPTKFAFYRDSFKFVLVLAGIAFCGFIYTVALFVHFGAPVTVILKRALDLFTISIPPALPVAMTIGVSYAVDRLQKEDIYCIAPSRVNVAGRVTTMCFDKTGTLTEDGLSVLGVHPGGRAGFSEDIVTYVDNATVPPGVIHPMAACHSLALLNGDLLGDPLDIQMFKASDWTLYDDPATQGVTVSSKFNKESFSLLKYFEFSSLLQRMSVIARHNQTGDMYVFCKGAPETIKTFCTADSVPRDFDDVLTSYTHQGKRVIALSSKRLGAVSISDAVRITRQEAELDLEFQALFILQNKLKGDTADVIRRLTEGRVSSIMVTGDNEYTAINVARECGIIQRGLDVYLMRLDQSKPEQPEVVFDFVPPSSDMGHHHQQESTRSDIEWYNPNVGLAVHAKAFQYIMSVDPAMFTKMLDKAVVYARMSPLNKSRLVENLQSQRNLTVGMCGDGSNDCGALKAADVGLSLSEAEASAAAPFTSKRPTIESVYLLLREGRCALATSIQVYKYMGIYSMIQTLSIIILYSIGYESRLKDPQFLWIDLGLIFPLAFLMSRTAPHEVLSEFRPPASLVNKSIVLSIISQIAIHLIFQVVVYGWTALSYVPSHYSDLEDEVQTNLKIAILFVFANFQYITSSVAYSIGRPFRKAFWTNYQYTLALLATCICSFWLIFHPDPFTKWLFTLPEWTTAFKLVLIVLALLNFLIGWSAERFAIVGLLGEAEGLRP